MQDRNSEAQFYQKLFTNDPETVHIQSGYEELYDLAFTDGQPETVLDLGCGTGAHSLRLAQRGSTVFGVELTHAGAMSAKKRLEAEGIKPLVIVADAENLPLRDGAVDTTWAALLLHHFPKREAVIAEIARVTRRALVAFDTNAWNPITFVAFNVVNPVMPISSLTPNQRALWPWQLRAELRKHGFAASRLHWVDRSWRDKAAGLRATLRSMGRFLPARFTSNKFLMTASRAS